MLKVRTTACALVIPALLAMTAGPTTEVHAASPAVGTCTFSGRATFSPGDQILPQANIYVTISGGGTCYGAGFPLGETMSITSFVGTVPIIACALGEGNMFGGIDFNGSSPLNYAGPGTFVGGPAAATLTIAGLFSASLTLAWSDPNALVACTTTSGASSTTVTGALTFVQA